MERGRSGGYQDREGVDYYPRNDLGILCYSVAV